jgi:hypothetical protein
VSYKGSILSQPGGNLCIRYASYKKQGTTHQPQSPNFYEGHARTGVLGICGKRRIEPTSTVGWPNLHPTAGELVIRV